jgi:hypothetical protein
MARSSLVSNGRFNTPSVGHLLATLLVRVLCCHSFFYSHCYAAENTFRKAIKLAITRKTICFFRGHVYSRFDRRKQPTCICCGPRRERYIDRRAISGNDSSLQIHQKHFRSTLRGRFVSAAHSIYRGLSMRGVLCRFIKLERCKNLTLP